MYPVLFRIGSFEVTTFGLVVAIAAMVGRWVFGASSASRAFRSPRVMPPYGGLLGGLVGAKRI